MAPTQRHVKCAYESHRNCALLRRPARVENCALLRRPARVEKDRSHDLLRLVLAVEDPEEYTATEFAVYSL